MLWALSDNLGSVRVLLDDEGNVVNEITYDAFGNVTLQTNAGTNFRFLYTGREFDSETGLYYNRARYYDPTTGKFISLDPIGFDSGDTNLYRYVGNNPLFYIDPFGFCGVAPGEEDNSDSNDDLWNDISEWIFGEPASASEPPGFDFENDANFTDNFENASEKLSDPTYWWKVIISGGKTAVGVGKTAVEIGKSIVEATQKLDKLAEQKLQETIKTDPKEFDPSIIDVFDPNVDINDIEFFPSGGDLDKLLGKDIFSFPDGDFSDLYKPIPDFDDDLRDLLTDVFDSIDFPTNDSQIKHIFRNKPGHLLDTPDNRTLLKDVANDPVNTLGNDRFGNTWHAKTLPDGTQVWVQTRKNVIINGGVNDVPKTYDPRSGLSRPTKP